MCCVYENANLTPAMVFSRTPPSQHMATESDEWSLQGFQKTGLGERVANMFVAACGKSTLGLAYGLSIAEAFLAPAMPSTTARAGGIFMPIINSLALSSGSEPGVLRFLKGFAGVTTYCLKRLSRMQTLKTL